MAMRMVLLATACLSSVVRAGEPSFTSFGPIPGDTLVEVEGVSADGAAVLVTSTGDIGGLGMRQLAVWRLGAGLSIPSGLDLRTAGQHVEGAAISADGTVITGTVSGLSGNTAFRWTQSGGYQAIGSGSAIMPRELSADGGVVVGRSGGTNSQANYWSQATGIVSLQNTLGGTSYANAASAGGSVIVGGAFVDTAQTVHAAFRWSAASGMTDLGRLPGANRTTAWDVSADGSVVVGDSSGPLGSGVFRWTAQGGMSEIATGSVSNYVRVTPDGTTVMANVFVPGGIRGMIWDDVEGRRDLASILPLLPGFDASEWSSITPVDISSDGRTIVGDGRDSQGRYRGWVATVPSPSVLLGMGGGLALAVRRRRAARRSGSGSTR